MVYKKYDIVFADLNPVKWSVQAGVCPCIVVQNNVFCNNAKTTLVVPVTSNIKKIFPSEFLISPSHINWLSQESRFLGSQISTLDTSYILKKIGTLEEKYYKELFWALTISLDLQDTFIDE